jgi:hypothetical protein
MIAYDKEGLVFALREGAELLVHDGASEAPKWRKTLDGDIVGLGADSEHVAAVTTAGTVTWFKSTSGDLAATGTVGGTVERAVFVGGKTCVAVTPSRIVAVTQGGATTLAEHGAAAIGVRPDGGVCVHHEGELVELAREARSIAPLASVWGRDNAVMVSGNVVSAIAWHPAGFWLIGAENKILRWDGSSAPAHVTQIPDAGQIEHLAAADEAIAFAWDKKYVGEMEWPSKSTLGDLMYVDKDVIGLDFGPFPWLGIALTEGDANKHNLLDTGRLHRSDTHPGREHHSWLVRVGGGGKDKDDDDRAGSRGSNAGGADGRSTATPEKSNPLIGFAIIAAVAVVVWLLFVR